MCMYMHVYVYLCMYMCIYVCTYIPMCLICDMKQRRSKTNIAVAMVENPFSTVTDALPDLIQDVVHTAIGAIISDVVETEADIWVDLRFVLLPW